MLPVNAGEMECGPLDERRVDQQDEGQDEGGEESGEALAARRVPQPRSPSAEERRLHDSTHFPARPWCKHCVYGAAAEYPNRTLVGENGESTVPRVMLDYCFFKEDASRLTDEHVNKEEAKVSPTALAMKETIRDSVWAYVFEEQERWRGPLDR